MRTGNPSSEDRDNVEPFWLSVNFFKTWLLPDDAIGLSGELEALSNHRRVIFKVQI